jgi:hypothetical protein
MDTILLATAASLIFCAPGYPGAAGDAQPFVDRFATAAATAAGWPAGSLAALYDPTEQGGVAKLRGGDAVLAFVAYPFFVEHAAELHLTPLAQADVVGTGPQERWTLVAKTGRVSGAPSMAGYTILSIAGYAPDFVRHSALEGWALPADVKVESTGQILSALRKVISGEKTAALLDQTQTMALPTLPFAKDLETVTQSPPVPVALVAVVNSRLPEARAHALQVALLKMGHDASASETLSSLRLQGFVLPKLPGNTTAK